MIQRLAHRYFQRHLHRKAVLLTREWLLGVRRGWLSLVHPIINSWADVLVAFDRLLAFIDGLEQQARYIRRGPAIIHYTDDSKNKLKLAITAFRQAISDNRSRAEDYATRNDLSKPDDFQAKVDATFKQYQTNFNGMLETRVRTKRNPEKDQWQPTRNTNVIELLDKILGILRTDAQRLQKNIKWDDDFAEQKRKLNPTNPHLNDPSPTRVHWEPESNTDFSIGKMRIRIDDTDHLNAREISEYVHWFREAYGHLQAKHLDYLWYGTLFVQCMECGGRNPHDTPDKVWGVGGNYSTEPIRYITETHQRDTIRIFSRPSAFIVELLIHELGHRLWYKKLSMASRLRFQDWIKEGVPAAVDGKSFHEPFPATSEYGNTAVGEAFAEMFRAYVLNKNIPHWQVERFISLLPA